MTKPKLKFFFRFAKSDVQKSSQSLFQLISNITPTQNQPLAPKVVVVPLNYYPNLPLPRISKLSINYSPFPA